MTNEEALSLVPGQLVKFVASSPSYAEYEVPIYSVTNVEEKAGDIIYVYTTADRKVTSHSKGSPIIFMSTDLVKYFSYSIEEIEDNLNKLEEKIRDGEI